jgi:hypothetical protein
VLLLAAALVANAPTWRTKAHYLRMTIRISMEVMAHGAILLGSSPHYCAAFAPIIENCSLRVKSVKVISSTECVCVFTVLIVKLGLGRNCTSIHFLYPLRRIIHLRSASNFMLHSTKTIYDKIEG